MSRKGFSRGLGLISAPGAKVQQGPSKDSFETRLVKI